MFILVLLIFTSGMVIAQGKSSERSVDIIYPVIPDCWTLSPDSIIRPLKRNSEYYGRVVFRAEADTISQTLKNFTILFASLKSRINVTDSIEIRLDYKVGTFKAFDSLTSKIIEHLSYLKVKPTNDKDCFKQPLIFTIPVKVE